MADTCGECRYFRVANPMNIKAGHVCRRYPPTAAVIMAADMSGKPFPTFISAFPPASKEQDCGEFKPREAVAAAVNAGALDKLADKLKPQASARLSQVAEGDAVAQN